MRKGSIILIAEDDEKDFESIRKNLLRAGIRNEILRFVDGRELLDFLFKADNKPKPEHDNKKYVLLLDILMPKVSGIEVLEKIKQDTYFKNIPVIILTAADEPRTIEQCHDLGCSTYIVKPMENGDFEETIQAIGHFLFDIELAYIK